MDSNQTRIIINPLATCRARPRHLLPVLLVRSHKVAIFSLEISHLLRMLCRQKRLQWSGTAGRADNQDRVIWCNRHQTRLYHLLRGHNEEAQKELTALTKT